MTMDPDIPYNCEVDRQSTKKTSYIKDMARQDNRSAGRWTFLTNHARVLLEIARDPQVRLRDVAATAGITERAAQAIVADLEAAGYVTRTRVGRRNRYTIDPKGRFRHPAEADLHIEGLLALFTHRESQGAQQEEPETGRTLSTLSAVASTSATSRMSAQATLSPPQTPTSPSTPASTPAPASTPTSTSDSDPQAPADPSAADS